MIIRRRHTANFTTIGNALFDDERLPGFEPTPCNPLAFRQPGQRCMVYTRTLSYPRAASERCRSLFYGSADAGRQASGLKISSRDAYDDVSPCCGHRDGTMSVEDFEVLRQHMLADISAGTFRVSGLIGKAALDGTSDDGHGQGPAA
jgi:hypothetical protein